MEKKDEPSAASIYNKIKYRAKHAKEAKRVLEAIEVVRKSNLLSLLQERNQNESRRN